MGGLVTHSGGNKSLVNKLWNRICRVGEGEEGFRRHGEKHLGGKFKERKTWRELKCVAQIWMAVEGF